MKNHISFILKFFKNCVNPDLVNLKKIKQTSLLALLFWPAVDIWEGVMKGFESTIDPEERISSWTVENWCPFDFALCGGRIAGPEVAEDCGRWQIAGPEVALAEDRGWGPAAGPSLEVPECVAEDSPSFRLSIIIWKSSGSSSSC